MSVFIEDIKKKFIMGIKRHDKMGWVKTGGKLGIGGYSPIIPHKRLTFVHKICIIFYHGLFMKFSHRDNMSSPAVGQGKAGKSQKKKTQVLLVL